MIKFESLSKELTSQKRETDTNTSTNQSRTMMSGNGDGNAQQTSNSYNDTINSDGILAVVLMELDGERMRRIKAEEEVSMLRSQLSQLFRSREQQHVSGRLLAQVQAERDGYKQLVEALTSNHRAIAEATRETNIPDHVIRMLEIVPWDDRARQHALATEDMYEWQIYKNGKWSNVLRHFPSNFRSLPVVKPKPGSAMKETTHKNSLFGELLRSEILTDAEITKLLKISDGYPLPEDGCTWQWVGGWRVEKRVVLESTEEALKHTVDCDEEGWSYGQHPTYFRDNPAELCWDHPGEIGNGSDSIQRPFRRRKWTRKRALLSYPHATERTTRYLKVQADNEGLSEVMEKLSEQLVITKTCLTQKEQLLLDTNDAFKRETQRLQADLAAREDELFRALSAGFGEGPPSIGSRLVHSITGNGNVRKVKNLIGNMGKNKSPDTSVTSFDDSFSSESFSDDSDEATSTRRPALGRVSTPEQSPNGKEKSKPRVATSLLDKMKIGPNFLSRPLPSPKPESDVVSRKEQCFHDKKPLSGMCNEITEENTEDISQVVGSPTEPVGQ